MYIIQTHHHPYVIRLFRENQPWNTYCQMDNLPNELKFSLGNRSPCRTFSLSIVTRFQNMKAPQESPEDNNGEYYRLRTIEWSVLEAPPKTIHYFSNLPFGWTPQSDLEFIELFMQTWKDDWISFCRDERRNLGHLVSNRARTYCYGHKLTSGLVAIISAGRCWQR